MLRSIIRNQLLWFSKNSVRPATVALYASIALALVISVSAHQPDQTQQSAPQGAAPTQAPAATPPVTPPTAENQPAAAPQPAPTQAPAAKPAPAPAAKLAVPQQPEITEAEIRQMLVGKDLYLRVAT